MNNSINPTDVQVFNRVTQCVTFARAAEELGITRSAVSKSLSRLEKQLGVVLLHRSTRRSSLTDAGRRFAVYAAEIEAMLANASAAVSGADQDVAGNLSVSLPTSLGAALVPLLVRKFRIAWPRLTLSLNFDERFVDLVGGSIDVAIRVAKRLDDSSLLSRSLGQTRMILVASPGYLAKYGVPSRLIDLSTHRCLALGGATQTRSIWRFKDGNGMIEVPIDSTINANTSLPLILAACMDEGILYIPELMVGGELASGRLVEILEGFSDSRRQHIFAVYPNRNPPAKVIAFIDFVTEELETLQLIDRWAPFADTQATTL